MTNRDKGTGRYVDTRFDTRCTCGHRLGDHTADRAHGVQPCLVDGCACEAFARQRARKAAKR